MLAAAVDALGVERVSIWIAVALAGACSVSSVAEAGEKGAESSAIGFLVKEVPAWYRENQCFSCHNNGDAARALYIGKQLGYSVPDDSLSDTTAWLRNPGKWDDNKGDPGFSDKRLANVQFAIALAVAHPAGKSDDSGPLQRAAERLIDEQANDGSWPVEPGNAIGSPATYGTVLATHLALEALRQLKTARANEAIRKGEIFLQKVDPKNVPAAAALLLDSAGRKDAFRSETLKECLALIRNAQTQKGGWGPYPDSPPEIFDTALVLLALVRFHEEQEILQMIRKGRAFLISQQNAGGSWPATTRPSGGESYAQLMSTTGWALQALFATKQFETSANFERKLD